MYSDEGNPSIFTFRNTELDSDIDYLADIVKRYFSNFRFAQAYPALNRLQTRFYRDAKDLGADIKDAILELRDIHSGVFLAQVDQTNGRIPGSYLDDWNRVYKFLQDFKIQDSFPNPGRVASKCLKTAGMTRTAGEVRFIKDKSNDATGWAWNDSGPQERKITPDFAFNPKNTKPLARVMRSTNAAMGHAMAAYAIFTKIKSADVSPDGSLGGKGYIQKIAEMRRAYMNVVEALSALSDTLYDEIRAPHWAAVSRQESPEEREEVEQIVGDALEIKNDPEGWAEDQEEEMDQGPDTSEPEALEDLPPTQTIKQK